MSLVTKQAEMLALTAGDAGPPAHVTVVIRSLSRLVVGSQRGLAGPDRACSWSANASTSSPSLRA